MLAGGRLLRRLLAPDSWRALGPRCGPCRLEFSQLLPCRSTASSATAYELPQDTFRASGQPSLSPSPTRSQAALPPARAPLAQPPMCAEEELLDSLMSGGGLMSMALPSQLLVLDTASAGAAWLAALARPVVSLPGETDAIFQQPPTQQQCPLPGQAQASAGSATAPPSPGPLPASPFAVGGSVCAQAAPDCEPLMAGGPFEAAAALTPGSPFAAPLTAPATPSSGSSGDAGWEESPPAVDQASSFGSEHEGWAAAAARQRRARAEHGAVHQKLLVRRRQVQVLGTRAARMARQCTHPVPLLFRPHATIASVTHLSVCPPCPLPAGPGGQQRRGYRPTAAERGAGRRRGRVPGEPAAAVASGGTGACQPAACALHPAPADLVSVG